MSGHLLSSLLSGDKFVSVEEHPYRGRYVVSNKTLEGGKVILKEAAYATAIFDSMRSLVCDHCLITSSSPFKFLCDKCKKTSYCSQKCKLNSKSCAEKSKGTTTEYQTASELVSNKDRMTPEMISKLTSVANYLWELAKKTSLLEGLTVNDLVSLLGSIQCNNFALKNFGIDKHYFGAGVFLRASLFNHSCAPNVTIKIKNGCIEFIMMEDVEAGRELNITYTDPSSPTMQQYLLENYLFDCQCSACSLGY